MSLDINGLSSTISKCFALSMDGRLGAAERRAYLDEGKRLRGLLLNLISAQFHEGETAVKEANARLAEVNAKLKSQADAIGNAATTLGQVNALVGVLDQLIKIALSFV